MKHLLFLLLFSSCCLFSQTNVKFEFTEDGLKDYVVTEVPGKSRAQIYTKTLEWINKTFNTPDKVIKGTVIDDYVRFQGIGDKIDCVAVLGLKQCNDLRYMTEISIKDGKYKFDIIEVETWKEASKFQVGGWHKRGFAPISKMKNKKGEIRSLWKYDGEILDYFNNLNTDLQNYILGNSAKAGKDDW